MKKNAIVKMNGVIKVNRASTARYGRAALLLLLVCAMAFSLCACGSKTDNGTGSAAPAQSSASSDQNAAASGQSADAASAVSAAEDSYVYRATFVPLNGDGDASYLDAKCWTEDGVYCTGEKIVGSRAPADATAQYYGQFDITEPALYFISYDGTTRELESYTPVSAPASPEEIVLGVLSVGTAAEASPEDGSAADALSDRAAAESTGADQETDSGEYTAKHPCEDVYEYYVYSYCNALKVLPDGNLLAIDAVYLSWLDTDELSQEDEDYYDHYIYRQFQYLRTLAPDGRELSAVAMEIPGSEWMYSDGSIDADGNVLFTRTAETGEGFFTAINPKTGETAYEIASESSIGSIYTASDGTVYMTVWSNDGYQLLKLDQNTHTLGDPLSLPNDAYGLVSGGGEYPFFYTSGVYCYGFDPASEEGAVKLFNWMDCDMDPDSAYYGMSVDSTGTIRVLVNDYDNYDMTYERSLAVIQKTAYDSAAQKQELVLATQYLGYELRSAVVAFNRKSDTTRIVVRDYSEYNTEDDYSAGLTKLQTEIMAGNCPDLIDMSGLNLSQIASKGLLEDLYPYLETDSELSREDFYANVLAAAENDGKLMHTVSYFQINTVVGASAIVGDEPGWTYEELENALRDMPEGCTPFDVTTTRDGILNTCLNLDMGDFVNWATGEVDFDNEEFISLLKFAAEFPESYDWETYDWQNDSAESRIAEGQQMLYATSIYGTDALNYLEAMYNGISVTFIGYPTNNGTGNTIEVDTGYAMSSSCSDKEAAWQFLRTFFTPSYFENHSYYGLPVQKELLEKKLKKACTPTYEIDDNGEYKLDANGEKIMEVHYYAVNSAAYTYYALSQDLADRFMDLLNTTDKVSVIDESIKDIVSKQAAAFFSGQKSAEEVAKLVQSNAKIYVNEQR